MPRYIDRDIALSHPFANGQYDKENANEHLIFGYEGYKEWLEQLPTVDAEPVIRCKDCKWWKTKYMRNGERKVCVIEAYEPVRNEDEYCSWAERKEDGLLVTNKD